MRRKLCYLMGAVLALGISMPGETMRAIADDGAGTQPVAIQGDSPVEGEGAEGLAAQEGFPDEDAPQAVIGEGTPEPTAAMPLRAPGASGFHATITSNKDSYSAGSTAIFAVKYAIDWGSFQEGDTITVSIPTEVASKVRLSVDPPALQLRRRQGRRDVGAHVRS